MTIAQKRNYCCDMAKGDIIIHMDDDDYYPPESVSCRVKILMKYRENGILCVGSSKIGLYDIIENKSAIIGDGNLSLSEASMGYWRIFWEQQKFNEFEETGEYRVVLEGRFENVMDIPFSFVICAIKHPFNMVNKKINNKYNFNFYDGWDEEVQDFIVSLRKSL